MRELCDLGERLAVDRCERERDALLGLDAIEREVQPPRRLADLDVAANVGVARDGVLDQRELDRRWPAFRDREIGDADRDRLTPPAERAVAAERVHGAKDLDEGVLQQILELAVGAQDAIQRAMHGGALLEEQLALGTAIARGGPPGQLEIVLARRGYRSSHDLFSGHAASKGRNVS